MKKINKKIRQTMDGLLFLKNKRKKKMMMKHFLTNLILTIIMKMVAGLIQKI